MNVICENAKTCDQARCCQHGKPHEPLPVTKIELFQTCEKAHRICHRTPSVPICEEVKE